LADMRYSYGRKCIVKLERNRITGYWILADTKYSYGREHTLVGSGTTLLTTKRMVIKLQYWVFNVAIVCTKLRV